MSIKAQACPAKLRAHVAGSAKSRALDRDTRHLKWLASELGDDLLDAAIVTTGPHAFRRKDGIAVIPAALLGPGDSPRPRLKPPRGRSSRLGRIARRGPVEGEAAEDRSEGAELSHVHQAALLEDTRQPPREVVSGWLGSIAIANDER